MPIKTILIDCLVLNGSSSGYRRVLKNLLIYVSSNPVSYHYVFVFQRVGWNSLGVHDLADIRSSHFSIIILPSFPSKWLRGFVEQLFIPILAVVRSASLVFMPATFGLFMPVVKCVTFVHTNTNFAVARRLRGRGRMQQFAHFVLARVTLFTSSQLLFTSFRTLVEFSNEMNVHRDWPVLGNGILHVGLLKKPQHFPFAPKTYMLSVSQIYRVKNHDTLIKSFIKFKRDNSLLECNVPNLVIVGTIQEPDYMREIFLLCNGRTDIYFMHDISDEELRFLYQNSMGYCLFSFFEGYSLTPAEALTSGLRIAISDIPTHREIYDDIPIYADPGSVRSCSDAIYRLFTGFYLGHEAIDDSSVNKFSFHAFFSRLENAFHDVLR